MFDREQYMKYVGSKSGSSYASGLVRIEKIYAVSIDEAYQADQCNNLLAQLEADKVNPALDAKEQKQRSDMTSHLKKYIEFMQNSNTTHQNHLYNPNNQQLSAPVYKDQSMTDISLNTILYGPPGTGKTYHTVLYAVAIIENKTLAVIADEDYSDVLMRYNEYKSQGRIEFTTFHQSYGYEEFIEGIKPVMDSEGNGDIKYAVVNGVLKDFCEQEETLVPVNRVFIIDEINRGNISKIFGELITLIEPSKRLGAKEGIKAILPYSKKAFGIPDNVYILGTMNTADRSIATLDTALRRRFDFVEMMPDENVLVDINVDGINISRMLGKINERISVLFDREHTIGHAYFIGLRNDNSIDALANIFRNKVIPLLQEYFYEDYEKIRLVLADNQVQDEDRQFVVAKEVKINELFGTNDVDIIDDTKRYLINNNAFENKEAYIKIYSK